MKTNKNNPRDFKFIVAATPKSGGRWMANFLSILTASNFPPILQLQESDLVGLPSNVILYTENIPNNSLVQEIRREGFEIITVSRHPYDVLINRLLEINLASDGVDRNFIATPSHPKTLLYAASKGFKDMISVGSQWSEIALFKFEYAELAQDRDKVISVITEQYKNLVVVSPSEAAIELKSNRLGQLEPIVLKMSSSSSGVWRKLIHRQLAERLNRVFPANAMRLNYICDPDPDLTPQDAEINWFRLMTNETLLPLADSLNIHKSQKIAIGCNVDPIVEDFIEGVDSLRRIFNSPEMFGYLASSEAYYFTKELDHIARSFKVVARLWAKLSYIVRKSI